MGRLVGTDTSSDNYDNYAEKLLESVNGAAQTVSNLHITFLLLATYIGLIIASTTDEQLLCIGPVILPLLNVELPIKGFYAVVPWLFFLFHFNLLLQLYLLARRLYDFDEALNPLPPQANRELRQRMFNFPYAHLLIGQHYGWPIRLVLGLIVWATIVLLPLIILLWAQNAFLPFHSFLITDSQRAALLADILVLWFFWPMCLKKSPWKDTWGTLKRWFDYALSFVRKLVGRLARKPPPERECRIGVAQSPKAAAISRSCSC